MIIDNLSIVLILACSNFSLSSSQNELRRRMDGKDGMGLERALNSKATTTTNHTKKNKSHKKQETKHSL